MRLLSNSLVAIVTISVCGLILRAQRPPTTPNGTLPPLSLGNFSISLNVKKLEVSKEFYEKMGFKVIAGDEKQNYLILQNETSTIGLFQGIIEKNSLTFNPGWDREGKTMADFLDVREIQKELRSRGISPETSVDENTAGPGYMMIMDPDGNPILIDQHASKAESKQQSR